MTGINGAMIADLCECVADLLPPALDDLVGAVGDAEPTPDIVAAEVLAGACCGVPGDPGLADEFAAYQRLVRHEYYDAAAAIDALSRWVDEPGHQPTRRDAERILRSVQLVKHAGRIVRALNDLTYARLCEVAEERERAAADLYADGASKVRDDSRKEHLQHKSEQARERARRFAELAARTR